MARFLMPKCLLSYAPMNALIKIFFLSTLASVSIQLYGQSDEKKSSDIEVVKRRMSNLKRMMDRDPNAVKDSLERMHGNKRREEALQRVSDYRNGAIGNFKIINLSDAGLDRIPDFVFNAISCETLILNDNHITRLPKELNRLTKLKEIQWMRNGLGTAKFKLAKLPQVNRLFVDNNGLKNVRKIRRLKNLTGLSLESNNFSKVPVNQLKRLKKLDKLDLSKNPIELSKSKYSKLSVSELSLSSCGLQSLDPSLYSMSELEELILAGNSFKSLPDGISELISLRYLSLYRNQLDGLPLDIGDMDALEEIDLYYNNLEKIPASIGDLSNLRVLYLSFNKIYDLPESLGELSKLERLYIHHNRLSYIPNGIGELNKLKLLHLQENYLPEFPSQVLEIEALRDLDISSTEITNLPDSLKDLKLKNFYYRGLKLDPRFKEKARHKKLLSEMTNNGVNCFPQINID